MTAIPITPAAVRLMLHRCGLSQTDAADWLGVEARMVRRWCAGDFPIPERRWQPLVDLCARQDRAADEALALIREKTAALGRDGTIAIHMARTQEDADRLGWPCPGAHVAVIRRVIERAPKGLRLVPVHPGEDEAADLAAERRGAH